MMKFCLQGINTDLEIELKRSKEYYDWSNEGKPDTLQTKIVFCNDSDACPVGTVEWTEQFLGLCPSPLNITEDLDFAILGREYGLFEGNQVPTKLECSRIFIKSRTKVKHQENGWHKPGELLMNDSYIWFEKFSSPIVGEFRVFLGRDGEILDIRNYIGYKVWPSIKRIGVIARELYKKINRAFSFDVVVLEDGQTYLLEIHDYWALGLYGFSNVQKLPFLIWDWFKYENSIISRKL